jgi:molybdate transport system ATP-binding protein
MNPPRPEAKTIVAHIHLSYPGFSLAADLELPGRGVTALFGHSGSGKTTLLRCVAGLERAPGGFLSVAGEVWQDDSRGIFVPTHRRPIGYVFQEASLFPHLSVRGNLEYGLKRVADGERRVSLDYAIGLLGIGHLLARMPEKLSGGEKQRVAIARAIALSPRVLLMDEPLAALDLKRKGEILPYLERLHDELEIPVLYVTHAPEEVARLADTVVVLESGRVQGVGPFAEVLARTDLSLSQGDEGGVALDAIVGEHDEAYHLSRVVFPGGGIWVRDATKDPVGRHVRIRILAKDVSLTLHRQEDTSIQNILQGHVVEIVDDIHPAQVVVKIDAQGVPLLSRITRRSSDALKLAPGVSVWAQIKAAALLR